MKFIYRGKGKVCSSIAVLSFSPDIEYPNKNAENYFAKNDHSHGMDPIHTQVGIKIN